MVQINMKTTPVRNARWGFTLIELLTVIAIIGILAAILVPTVSKVRESANSTQNRSNVRTITQANILYEVDNKIYAPNSHTWTDGRDPYYNWAERVAVYCGFRDWDPSDTDGPFTDGLPPPGVFRIPQSPFLYKVGNINPMTEYNRNIGFYGSQSEVSSRRALSSSKGLINPSAVWMITDNSHLQTNGVVDVQPNLNNLSIRPGRFGGYYTFGMADGSMKVFRAGQIPAATGPTEVFHNVMKNY